MASLRETEDGWEFTPDPGLILRAVEGQITEEVRQPLIWILDGEDEWQLRFNQQSYQLASQDRHRELSVESLVENGVTQIRVLNSGVLYAEFNDGSKLTVEPALKYEAWELRRNGEIMMFALPLGAEFGVAAVYH